MTLKVYSLTSHKGVRSFRNSFLLFGLSFIIRFINITVPSGQNLSLAISIAFNYLISIAGFSLIYSLVWKDFPEQHEYILHIVALIIGALTTFLIPYLMFITQIALFLYAIVLSYANYKSSKKSSFPQLYFICIFLGLLAYIINFASIFVPKLDIYVKAITATVFIIFLLGVYKTLKWPKKESA
jgi:hypothetical protein